MRSETIVRHRRMTPLEPVPQRILQAWRNARREAAKPRDPLYDSPYNQKKIALLRECCELLRLVGRRSSQKWAREANQ